MWAYEIDVQSWALVILHSIDHQVRFFFFKQKTAYEIYRCDWSFRRVLFRSEQAGGTVEQAPLSPLLRAAIDAFDEAGPDAAFEQGLAVIVDGLAKRRLVVRNVEGPRKGDD